MASFEATNTAPVKWAQRTDSLYVTISLPDVKDHHIDVTANQLSFKGKSGDKAYHVTLDFFKEIETEGSVWNVLPASVQMKLNKKEKGEKFWPRLLKDKALEKNGISVDWDRYVDEDEQDGDFDMSNLDDGGMGFGGASKMRATSGGGAQTWTAVSAFSKRHFRVFAKGAWAAWAAWAAWTSAR